MHKNRIKELEEFIKENEIPIKSHELLNIALTHTSYANEHKKNKEHDNERLEFLGDAVLDLIVGEYLFRKYPLWSEGELTKAKASAVCKPACAEISTRLNVGKYLLLGKGEEKSGGRTRVSILGDAFESLIGAIYLDIGYEVTFDFVIKHLEKFLDLIMQGDYDKDYKTDLQEILQQNGDVEICYNVIHDEGPDHDKTIWMSVTADGKYLGSGIGKSKKQAAQRAAKEAIERIEKEAKNK